MCALAWLLRAQVLTAIGGLLVKEDSPSKADVILVLGGDGFGTRILKGAELVRAGYAPKAWVSGGVSLVGHEADTSVQYAGMHGFPASLFQPIYLPQDADSTRGEAIFIGKELKAKGVHKLLLVTSNFHTRRAGYLWRTENPWLHTDVVASSDPNFSPGTWWKTRAGQKTFLLESVKTIASHLGH